jgi:putative Ca2+/H+ antiporter (TMEM165/GDT1 family)
MINELWKEEVLEESEGNAFIIEGTKMNYNDKNNHDNNNNNTENE